MSKFFSHYINLKKVDGNPAMQKKFGHEKTTIEVDPITGEYYTIIPEWIMHDQDWFEGTSLNFALELDEVIIKESDD